MKLTPLDIEQQQFRQIMRGWDPEEVRRFLQQVGDRVEELIRENTGLRDETRRLEQQVAEFRAHEGQLRQALVSAGRMGEEIKESARREAELVRAEAELQAEKIVASARDDVVRYAEQVRDLRLQKARVLGELRTVVDAHRRLLDTHDMLDREDASRRETEAESVRRSRVELRVADSGPGERPATADLRPLGGPRRAAVSTPPEPSPISRTGPDLTPLPTGRSGLSEAALFDGPGGRDPDGPRAEQPVRRGSPPPGRRHPPTPPSPTDRGGPG